MKHLKCIVGIGLLLALPTAADAQVLRCEISSKFRCDAGTGCQKTGMAIWNLVDLTRQTISRCDAKGCETYPAQFATSGAFVNIAVPANGMLAKLSSDGTMFLEAATQMNTALISFGSCRPQ